MMDLKQLVTNSRLIKKMGIYIISVEGSTLISYFYLPRSNNIAILLAYICTGFTSFQKQTNIFTGPKSSHMLWKQCT